MTDEINVSSRTQVINLEPTSGAVSLINAGPVGPTGTVPSLPSVTMTGSAGFSGTGPALPTTGNFPFPTGLAIKDALDGSALASMPPEMGLTVTTGSLGGLGLAPSGPGVWAIRASWMATAMTGIVYADAVGTRIGHSGGSAVVEDSVWGPYLGLNMEAPAANFVVASASPSKFSPLMQYKHAGAWSGSASWKILITRLGTPANL